MLTAFFVAARIVSNPISNALQKRLAQRQANPIFIIAVTHALLTLAVLPVAWGSGATRLGGAFWWNIALCATLAVASNVLLVFALRTSDLSVLGPLNAYKSVVSLALGIFLIGELPAPMGLAGVLLIVAGSYFVVDRDARQSRQLAVAQFFGERGVQLRLAALCLSATEAVFLKKAILAADPVKAFVFWSILGLPVAAMAVAMAQRHTLAEEVALLRSNWRTYLFLGAATGTMQLTTLLAFGKMQVGYSLALFQLSTLIGVFLGYRYFQEGQIGKRLIGAAIMSAGATLIVLQGRR
ncbi:MAG: EamA family transporter [Candidatus Solibacter sp.]